MCNCYCHKIIGQGGFDTGYTNNNPCATCCYTKYDYYGSPNLIGSIKVIKENNNKDKK